MNARERLSKFIVRGLLAFVVFVFALGFGLGMIVGVAVGDELVDPTPEEYADIQTWISSSCCWTNNCCKKVKPSALTPLGNDEWRVEATGQINKRTGWSRDGNTWRCTCDYVGTPGRWVTHPKANTRCIFPVASGS